MAEDKKTQMGTGSQPAVKVPGVTPGTGVPSPTTIGTPAPRPHSPSQQPMNLPAPPPGSQAAIGIPAPASVARVVSNNSDAAIATQMIDSAQVPAISQPPVSKSSPPANAAAAAMGLPAPPPGPSSSAFVAAAPSGDPLIGQTLADRYYVQKKLGEGGMGAVYLATHRVLEKQVALKVLHGEFARKADLVERFMQEAKAASRIRHENVIDVSDFGSTPDGLVFFAMELLKGHDLHDEIARARIATQLLPWERTKRIFLQICSALSVAHSLGIVHRDLKPENVYLVEFLGDTDFVKLLDFGIAKLTEVNEEGRKLTRTGMLFGTPEYMSPEQARGDTADHRVDVYAMGCILFQLITTRVPFEAENFMSVLSLHLTEPPPQIPDEVFDAVGAPRALGGVIDKALEKDKAARWQSMDELANAVREVCGDPPPGQRATKEQPAIRNTSATPIAAPALTKIPRPKTEAPKQTPRPRTQWTGTVKVPEEKEEAPRAVAEKVEPKPQASSKLPLIIGGAIIVAGGAVAAALVMSGKKEPAANPPPPPPPLTFDAGVAVVTPPPTPDAATGTVTPPSDVPKEVTIHFTSTPKNAQIVDLADKLIGLTPYDYKLPGDLNPKQFKIKLDGYDAQVITVPLDKPEVTETVPLVRHGGGGVRPLPIPNGGSNTPPKLPPDAGVQQATPIDAAAPPPPKPDAPPAKPCAPDPVTGGCLPGTGP